MLSIEFVASFVVVIALLGFISFALIYILGARKKSLRTTVAYTKMPSRKAYFTLNYAERVEVFKVFYARNYAECCLGGSPFDCNVYEMFSNLKKKYDK